MRAPPTPTRPTLPEIVEMSSTTVNTYRGSVRVGSFGEPESGWKHQSSSCFVIGLLLSAALPPLQSGWKCGGWQRVPTGCRGAVWSECPGRSAAAQATFTKAGCVCCHLCFAFFQYFLFMAVVCQLLGCWILTHFFHTSGWGLIIVTPDGKRAEQSSWQEALDFFHCRVFLFPISRTRHKK